MSDSRAEPPRTTESIEFPLMAGGPLFRLYLKCRLARPQFEWIQRRVIVIPLIIWAPLLVLSFVEGTARGGVRIPFLYDLELHAKYLLAVPLLIIAEALVHRRLSPVVAQFVERGIVRSGDVTRFRDFIASAMKWRSSMVAEVLLLVFVYTVGHLIWRDRILLEGDTWYARHTGSTIHLTKAGYWYGFVAAPIAQFLLLRWYFRMFIWARFLWQVSRLDLHLVPTHPDRSAGLGFLGNATYAFGILLCAQGTMLSGMIAERLFFEGVQLTTFKYEIAGAIALMLVVAVGPLCVFVLPLSRAKRAGLREYGVISSRYVGEFEQKWVRGGTPRDRDILGSGDIQSLADLANSYAVVREMRFVPFGAKQLVYLAFVTAAPVLPLALTMIPPEELIRRIVGALF